MIKYKVLINMAETGEPAQWEEVDVPMFSTRAAALKHIEWMKKEYGDTIEYRAQPHAEYPTQPAYYEAEGGSMWNGIGRNYF